MLQKQKSLSLPRNLALRTFGKLLVFSTRVNLLYFHYWTNLRCCLLHLIKQNNFLKAFQVTLKKNFMALYYGWGSTASRLEPLQGGSVPLSSHNLDDSGVSLRVFPSRTNLKLHNISITPKMVKNVVTNLDSSKVPGPDFIPVVILKNCEPELLYILPELFNMCLREIVGRFHWYSLYFP